MIDLVELEKKLDALKQQHRTLDEKIEKVGPQDQFQAMRLKKEKLHLRDNIIAIESQLYPDIIA